MQDRLDLAIATDRGPLTVPWPARAALLTELELNENGHAVRDAIKAVGATRPVELKTRAHKAELIRVIDEWGAREGGRAGLPDGIFALRDALEVDLVDAWRKDSF